MSNEHWDISMISSITERVSVGHVGPTSIYFCSKEVGVPLIRSQNVRPGKLDLDGVVFITKEFHRSLKKSKVTEGDVLIVRVGQNRGDCCIVPEGLGEMNCANIILIKPGEVHPKYLESYLRSPYGQHQLLSLSTGSAQAVINTKAIAGASIPVPSYQEQIKIGAAVSMLDDKITLLRQQNATLESMAQALFKSWFVDFDPVVDNALAAGRVLPEALQGKAARRRAVLDSGKYAGLPEEVKGLFPGFFVFSEELGRWVPEGWEVTNFGSLLENTIGGDWGKEAEDEKHSVQSVIIRGTDIPYIKQGNRGKAPTRWVEPKKLAKRILEPSDIVIEVSGGSPTQSTGRSVLINKGMIKQLGGTVEPASFCRRFRPIDEQTGSFLASHLDHLYGTGKMWGYQTQSTGIANFQTTYFLGAEIFATPPNALLSEFHARTSVLSEKQNGLQIQTLTRLRDVLLPELISGRLGV